MTEGLPAPWMVGAFGQGAYGPTIILKLLDERGVERLRSLFEGMVDQGVRVDLTVDVPGVEVRGLDRFELVSVGTAAEPHLRESKKGQFVWANSADEWHTLALLLDPFLAGRTGHQYMTDEDEDDALVEVSYGEPGVRV